MLDSEILLLLLSTRHFQVTAYHRLLGAQQAARAAGAEPAADKDAS